MTLILFIIVLGVLILTHEFGHFIVAKRAGVRVDEFGLGFPPRLWGFKYGETIYSINWIPFGGFVRIYGENQEEDIEGKDKGRSLINKPRYIQALVLIAGVTMNVLLAWLLISFNLSLGMPVSLDSVPTGAKVENVELLITSVVPNFPADKAGLKPGDALLSLKSVKNSLASPNPDQVMKFVSDNSQEKITLDYQRKINGQTKNFETTLMPQAGIGGKPMIGIGMDQVGLVTLKPWQALYWGLQFTWYLTVNTVIGFGTLVRNLFTEGRGALADVAGPVGLFSLIGDAGRMGLVYVLNFMAVISVNLAVINLLPFPALDGGRLLFLLIEAVRRKAISSQISNALNLAGFVLLILLMVFVTINDLTRIF